MSINNFKVVAFAFLSNMFPCTISYEGLSYRCVESFFQAMKTTDKALRATFCNLDGYQAKRAGRMIDLRPDWNKVRTSVMAYGLKAKFSNPALAAKLKATGNEDLIEGNTWHDNFWGSCSCPKCGNKGANNLGKMLMKLRAQIP